MFQQRAYTVTVPRDWVFDGTVIRTHFGPSQVFRTSSRDGLTGLQALPRYDWVATNNPGMQSFYRNLHTMMGPPMAASEVLTKVVLPEARPGVEVVGLEKAPFALAQATELDWSVNAQYEAQARGTRQRPSHITSDAARVRIRYQLHGHKVEELLIVTSSVTVMPLLQGGEMQLSSAYVSAGRAPVGQLDDASARKIFGIYFTAVVDQKWQAEQNAFQARSAQQKQQAILANAERYRRANEALFKASMSSAKALSTAGHVAAMGTADQMGDVQSMINPSTGQPMKVSNQYSFSYADEAGNVVHTNSATFNPNGQMRGNWTQLQPMSPE